MSSAYTVQQGDTLWQIAREHGTTVADLQALNPIIVSPYRITPGWELALPDAAPVGELPPPMAANCADEVKCEGQAPCTEELVDVAYITGEPHFYVLTERESKDLKQEIDRVQTLMDELNQRLLNAVPSITCKKPQDPQADCACARCVKEAWAAKAEEAGLLARDTHAQPSKKAPLTTDQDLQGQLAGLQQARDWYKTYTPRVLGDTYKHNNWRALQSKKIAAIEEQIDALRTQLAAQKPATSSDSATLAKATTVDQKHGRGRSMDNQRGITVVEISLLGDPSRRHYIALRYLQTIRWNVRVSTQVMAGKPFNKQLATDLIKDIKDAVGGGRRAGPLGNLEFKIASWTSDQDNLLNALHQSVAWSSNQSDAAPYAISTEAHALRFAASASAGVNNWNPGEGNIDIGIKGSAALSLVEASVTLNAYFPDQGGYVASMSYRNALGEEVLHPLGVFRLSGKLELSCFIGARVQTEAGGRLQYKPSEVPAGATALLGTPTMEVGRSGSIGVKGDGFAGAQASGALSGAFEWVEPHKQGTGPMVPGQSNASGSWAKLAEVKVEGNLAFGVGLGGEFGLSVARDRLVFNCRASVVFGPGAGGGFATVVDLEQVGKVALLFCEALAKAGYRRLLGVTEQAFDYVTSSLYRLATSPKDRLNSVFGEGVGIIERWWTDRKASMAEAQNLATYVLNHKDDKVLIVAGQPLPFGLLPPETLGPMVYVLTESFILTSNQEQEEALVILISEIRNWRQFIEVLEHCSPNAEKVNAMKSLERINSLLSGYEQHDFNNFVSGLVLGAENQLSMKTAWKPSAPWFKQDVMLAARESGRFDGLA